MATAIDKIINVFYGTSEPTTGDKLCEEVNTYPVNTLYINKADGALYIRSATNKLAADWVSLTAHAGADPTMTAPTLYGTVLSATAVELNWEAIAKATNYIVQRSTASNFSGAVEIYNGALTTYKNTGLTTATQYYFRVKAQATGYTDSAWTSINKTTL